MITSPALNDILRRTGLSDEQLRSAGVSVANQSSPPVMVPAVSPQPGPGRSSCAEIARKTTSPPQPKTSAVARVVDLASAKRLPLKFLHELGLKDVVNGVSIEYRLMDGSLALRQRIRLSPPGEKNHSVWDKHSGVIVPYGLDRLRQAYDAGFLVVAEGESDCWTLWHYGFPALGIPGATMAHTLQPEYLNDEIARVYIVQEPGDAGKTFVQKLTAKLRDPAFGWKGDIFVVTLGAIKDPSDLHIEDPAAFSMAFNAALDSAIAVDRAGPQAVPSAGKNNPVNPWSLATGMDVFLRGEEEAVKFLFAPVILKEAVTEIFSPRGLGKSLWALFVAVYLALAGYKVLLIDRDNPRRLVRERLRSFGATSDLTTLKILSRENAPPLTNTRAWAEFPYFDYDLVIVDSLDSAAEGVGEQDSTKPSLALAPLLDIARRENGPGVLLIGNTVRTGAHSRGSGIVEDRADVVFEIRDATNFHPTGKKPWIEELPAADAGSWAGRSTRRKRLSQYRLAFVATKFRVGEEPEPFIVEIDLDAEPWTVRNVTDDVDRDGAAARAHAAVERAATIRTATESLKAEILRREASGETVLLKNKAEDFLTSRDNISRSAAREIIKSPDFETVELPGKGHPKGVRLAGKNDSDGGNSTPTEPAPDAGSSYGHFRRPHPEHPAEIPPHETRYPCGSESTPISAEPRIFTPPEDTETAFPEPEADPNDEVIL